MASSRGWSAGTIADVSLFRLAPLPSTYNLPSSSSCSSATSYVAYTHRLGISFLDLDDTIQIQVQGRSHQRTAGHLDRPRSTPSSRLDNGFANTKTPPIPFSLSSHHTGQPSQPGKADQAVPGPSFQHKWRSQRIRRPGHQQSRTRYRFRSASTRFFERGPRWEWFDKGESLAKTQHGK